MADNGWVRIDRDIMNNWLWSDKPFSRGQAFIDLILTVNHKDNKMVFNGKMLIVKRGQIVTSIGKLQNRWGWSRDKVYRFLNELEEDEMIIKESNNFRTLITIVNYGLRQDGKTTHQTTHQSTNKTTEQTTHQTTHQTQTTMRNNDKQCNNENNKPTADYSDDVSEKSYEQLNAELGDDWG